MTSTLRLASLLLAGLMFTACDDDESTSNVPPDLKLEDVVGCWYWSGDGYCRIQCFDPAMLEWYQTYDSSTLRVYESVGRFEISGNNIHFRAVDASSTGVRGSDSIEFDVGYVREVGLVLKTIGKNNQDGIAYHRAYQDSQIQCGKPFLLFPKPPNWTLF